MSLALALKVSMAAGDEEDEGDPRADMIAWLRGRGPDDWHFVGSKLNWDSSVKVIEWILDQKNCDKATAAMMFWLSSPDYFLEFPNRAAMAAHPYAQVNLWNFDFTKKLVDRWNSGFYTRSAIAFTPEPADAYERYQKTAAAHSAAGLPWTIGADIGAMRQGEDVTSDRAYRTRYSDELARLLLALGTDIPHPNRMHGSRGTLTGRLRGILGLD
jgi:hypothetical protein